MWLVRPLQITCMLVSKTTHVPHTSPTDACMTVLILVLEETFTVNNVLGDIVHYDKTALGLATRPGATFDSMSTAARMVPSTCIQ